MYDVIIVGAGPAGLFSAYELITKNKKMKVLVLDQGKLAEDRVCPMNKYGTKCKNCKPCNILSGFGGAGTFSDGKLNYVAKLGKSDLYKYMNSDDAEKLLDDTEKIFNFFGMDSDVYPTNMEEAKRIEKLVALTGAKLLLIKQKHLGSDKLPGYITSITDFLKKKGVDLIDNVTVSDVVDEKGTIEVIGKKGKEDVKFLGKNVIVAPGRTGAKWIQSLADKYKIPYLSQSIEIGVRVEVRRELLEDLCSVIYDPSIFIKTKTYGDEIRTFCTNPGGFVTKEKMLSQIIVILLLFQKLI